MSSSDSSPAALASKAEEPLAVSRYEAFEARRAALLAKMNTALCFECQIDDGRALRRLDANNRDLLICKECAMACYMCEHQLGEYNHEQLCVPITRAELINNTSIEQNAHEHEEHLCREHWEEIVDRDVFGEDEMSLQSDDERSDPSDDDDDNAGYTSSNRRASHPLRFNWDGAFRRGYPTPGQVDGEFELEAWEWRTDGEEHAEAEYVKYKARIIKSNNARRRMMHATKISVEHERPTEESACKRVSAAV
jgi:hypothetical protein